jgi:hypothetical protein
MIGKTISRRPEIEKRPRRIEREESEKAIYVSHESVIAQIKPSKSSTRLRIAFSSHLKKSPTINGSTLYVSETSICNMRGSQRFTEGVLLCLQL